MNRGLHDQWPTRSIRNFCFFSEYGVHSHNKGVWRVVGTRQGQETYIDGSVFPLSFEDLVRNPELDCGNQKLVGEKADHVNGEYKFKEISGIRPATAKEVEKFKKEYNM